MKHQRGAININGNENGAIISIMAKMAASWRRKAWRRSWRGMASADEIIKSKEKIMAMKMAWHGEKAA